MEFARCTEFATEHPICYVATEDGDQPRVRALLLWFADERGFYFMTMSPKGFSHQLHHNPKVEVCVQRRQRTVRRRGDARHRRGRIRA